MKLLTSIVGVVGMVLVLGTRGGQGFWLGCWMVLIASYLVSVRRPDEE